MALAPRTPGTAQQLQQQRFCLVVGMVRHSHKIAGLLGKSRMAQLARRSFDALLTQWRDVHAFDVQGNVKACANFGTEIRPTIRIRADAVMDMQCGQLPGIACGEFMQQMHQYHRVHATAQTDQDRTMRRKQRRDLRCHTFGEIN